MRSLVVAFSATLLSGCGMAGRDANIYRSPFGQRVVGNEAFVTISNVWNEMDALPLAERHCQQHGRSARYREKQPYRVIFDCVERASSMGGY